MKKQGKIIVKWVQIPDELIWEANGHKWQETLETDGDAITRDFRLRYSYSTTRKNFCVDIIQDCDDGVSRIVFPAGIYEEPQNMHRAAAAIEAIFPTSDMIKDKVFSKLSALLSLYEDEFSQLPKEYFDRYKEDLGKDFLPLWDLYKFARDNTQEGSSVSEQFKNVVEVDFKSGKRADKHDADLLERVRDAIQNANDNDSPLKHVLGTPKPQ